MGLDGLGWAFSLRPRFLQIARKGEATLAKVAGTAFKIQLLEPYEAEASKVSLTRTLALNVLEIQLHPPRPVERPSWNAMPCYIPSSYS
jgi:hypothetical protein